MQVSKIITRYGVLKNPSAIETKMVLTNPINAKAFIEKPFPDNQKRASDHRISKLRNCQDLWADY